MDEHIRIIISIIVICLILFLTTLPQSHCQLLPPPPPFNHTICKEQSYSCGDLSNNISYPFWDGNNRHRHCGGGDLFHLHCQGGHDTTILIGPQNFTVLEIHPETHIMRMKQTELAHDVCSPPKFNDTYLSPTLFRYPTSVYNITIFYDCPSDVIRTYGHPICDNKATFHPTTKDEALEAYPDFRRCGRHVQVPYSTLPPGGVELDLERAIDDGFVVRYNVDEDCVRCLGGARSDHGDCWNSTNDTDIEQHVQRSCDYSYCPDGSASTTHCSPAAYETLSTAIPWKRKIILDANHQNE